jgi:hypothetical protein
MLMKNQPLAVLLVACSIMSACATRSIPAVPDLALAPAVDPRLCAPAPTEPPIRGSVVAPVGTKEREATRLFLNSVAELADWGRSLAIRAEVARAAC